jgi:transcription elongation factor Elf1
MRSQAMIKELKNCPFCGHPPDILKANDDEAIIKCLTCIISPQTCLTFLDDAINIWNERR